MNSNREIFLLHCRALILGFYSNTWRLIGADPTDHLPDSVRCWDLTIENIEAEMGNPELIRFLEGDFMTWFEKVYDYGIEGVFDQSKEPEDEEESCLPFWLALESLLLFIANNCDFDVQKSFDLVNSYVQKYLLRYALDNNTFRTHFIDDEPCIFLTDLAGLADLDEKTIRNMASKKPEGFPTLYKEDKRTYVRKREARAWLISRGWKDTVYVDANSKPLKFPDPFRTLIELQEVFEETVELAKVHFGKTFPFEEDWYQRIKTSITDGNLDLSFGDIDQWGKYTQLDSCDLALEINALKARLQAEKISQYFGSQK
jgi:hypothetical protein